MKNRGPGVHKPQTSLKATGAKSDATPPQEIAEHERAESELRRLSRALLTMSQCNRAVVRAQSEQELLESVCRSMVDAGGYRMGWVGYAEHDAARQVRPLAHAGFEDGYLSLAQITWGSDEHGRGPTGRAIRSGRPEINRLTQTDDTLSPWREEALKRGYLSSIALPLRSGGQTLGALTLYAEEPEAFDHNEVKLLSDLAEDLSFGIDTLRTRAEHQRAEEERKASEARFRTLIEEAPLAISISRNLETIYINRMFRHTYGIQSVDEFVGKSILEQWAPESRAMVMKHGRERALGLPAPTQYDGIGLRQDGSHFPVQVTVASVDLPDGPASMAFLTDLTERKRTEEQLHLTQFSLEHASDPVFWMDPRGRIVYVNEAACRSLGRSREELLSSSIPDIDPSFSAEYWRAAWEEVKAKASITFETCHRTKDGRTFPVEVTSNYLQFRGKEYAFAFARDITERRQAAEALRQEKAFTEAVIDSFPDVFFVIQETGKFLHWGRNPEKVLGYTDEETMAMKSAVEIVAEEDRPVASRAIQEAFAHGSTAVEVHLLHRDGRKIPYLVRATRALIGQERYMVGLGLDISERKHAEEALRQSEAALKEALLAAQMGVWNLTIEAGTVAWDENLYRLAGRDSGLPAPNYQELSQIYTPASWERLKSAVENALTVGTPYELDMEMLRPDGTKRCWISRGAPVRDASGHITGLRGTVQDITERMQADQRIRESEEKFRKAFMTGADAFHIATLDEGEILEVNDASQQVFGYTREETIGKTATELGLYTDPKDRQRMVSEVKARGYVKNMELQGRKKNGELFYALLSVSKIHGEGEDLILGVARDITEKKRAEEALREREARLKEAEKLAHLGSSTWDVATDTTTWSDELYRIVGRAPDLAPPKHAERAAIYTPESWERLEIAVRQALATGAPYDLELDVVRPDGTKRHVHARGVAERAPDGSIVRLQGTLQDVTEHHRLEQQFRQAQKMEAVGRLAGGVAHDFNNLLTVINGYSEMALEALGPDDPKRTHFSEIRKAGERAAGLTRQLLAFSRQQVLAPRVLDLNAIIADMEKMLRRLIGEDVDLAVVQGPALGQVKADPGQIEQIIMNLAVNARDAMPHGGKLVITTTNTELDKNDIEKIPSVVRGHYVMLAVIDTGIGMDAQTQAHIFEPFFTTKEQGKGTGLGLATVYGIVKQSGGYIWVYSVPGQGTTFKIYLPRVDEPNEPFLTTKGDARSLGGSETILLVEDEKEISALAVRVLQTRGYEVLESASPEDALQMSARHNGPIHLLLTDVVMPGMSGRKVAEHLSPLRPNMKVLYMSGYTDDSVFRNGVLEPGAAFIQKPFTPSSLARKVREVLNEPKLA